MSEETPTDKVTLWHCEVTVTVPVLADNDEEEYAIRDMAAQDAYEQFHNGDAASEFKVRPATPHDFRHGDFVVPVGEVAESLVEALSYEDTSNPTAYKRLADVGCYMVALERPVFEEPNQGRRAWARCKIYYEGDDIPEDAWRIQGMPSSGSRLRLGGEEALVCINDAHHAMGVEFLSKRKGLFFWENMRGAKGPEYLASGYPTYVAIFAPEDVDAAIDLMEGKAAPVESPEEPQEAKTSPEVFVKGTPATWDGATTLVDQLFKRLSQKYEHLFSLGITANKIPGHNTSISGVVLIPDEHSPDGDGFSRVMWGLAWNGEGDEGSWRVAELYEACSAAIEDAMMKAFAKLHDEEDLQ